MLQKDIGAQGVKFYIGLLGDEVARVYLYVLRNDLHEMPFGFMEDLFVAESHRGEGLGSELVRKVIEEARKRGCYKLVCTSRFSREGVHKIYTDLGFKEQGLEFRIDF